MTLISFAKPSSSLLDRGDPGDAVIDLDANANVAPTPSVIDAVTASMRLGAGNPSSGHMLGDRARADLMMAREAVTLLLDGAVEEEVVFTSGCTEANNAILHQARAGRFKTVVVAAVEHASVLRPAERLRDEGIAVEILGVGADGLVHLEELEQVLGDAAGPVLVSIQIGNSETGVIQPVSKIAKLVARTPTAVFHADAAQAFGKMIIGMGSGIGPHIVTLSGHKLHAPMGIGAIVFCEGGLPFDGLIVGGEQEQNRRAGTQSVALIAGLKTACEERAAALDRDVAKMCRLRDRLENAILSRVPTAAVNGGNANRLPNVTNLRFDGVDAMAMIANLDARGIAASQGSACSSRRPEPSHVLMAMGLSEREAFSSVRFSVSPLNTDDEIDRAVGAICAVAGSLQDVL